MELSKVLCSSVGCSLAHWKVIRPWWNSELFSLPGKGSERNSERFLFRGTAGIPSEIPICSGYFIFRGIMFCRKFPTLVLSPPDILLESCGLFSEWLLILYPMKLSNSF